MNVFSLSATLTLDVAPFTQAVRQAESAAAALEGTIAARLSAATARLRALQSVAASAAPSTDTRRTASRSLVVSLDGERVGSLVASAVSDTLARQARERRYEQR